MGGISFGSFALLAFIVDFIASLSGIYKPPQQCYLSHSIALDQSYTAELCQSHHHSCPYHCNATPRPPITHPSPPTRTQRHHLRLRLPTATHNHNRHHQLSLQTTNPNGSNPLPPRHLRHSPLPNNNLPLHLTHPRNSLAQIPTQSPSRYHTPS